MSKVDSFNVYPGFDDAQQNTDENGALQIDLWHGWAAMTLPLYSNKSTYSYHNLVFRVAKTQQTIAQWKGQIFADSNVKLYLSHWLGTSINLNDPRYVVNVSWNVHSRNGMACWFGDSMSFEQPHMRKLNRWTHLIEYPGNGSWSGFLVIKNLLEKSTPTQFWAGSGNTTTNVLSKDNWIDYTHIWLGTEEDKTNADRNLSRGWIWTMLISIFVLCIALSCLVFWLTRERVSLKGKRRTSWMKIIRRKGRRNTEPVNSRQNGISQPSAASAPVSSTCA